MFKVLVFMFLIEQSCTLHKIFNPTRASGRILNGSDAEVGEFPFAIAVYKLVWSDLVHSRAFVYVKLNGDPMPDQGTSVYFGGGAVAEPGRIIRVNLRTSYDNSHLCGATILNTNFVLTAAHCLSCKEDGTSLSDPEDYNVQYGLVNITDDDTNSIDIKQIYCSNYTLILSDDYTETLYDIAVAELANPLPDDGSWAPVTLSRVFDSSVQQQGVIIGWGINDEGMTQMSTILQKLTVDVYNNTACGAVTRNHWDHHVCVGSKSGIGGTCYGDSGTAALVNGMQVGITSYLTTHPPICGHENVTYPTVYSRVEKYFDWILDITPNVQRN